MGFFKELKDDWSQAVNELLPEDELNQEDSGEQMVNTLDDDLNASDDASNSEKMNELLEELTKDDDEIYETVDQEDDFLENLIESDEGGSMDDNVDLELLNTLDEEDSNEEDELIVRAASVASDDVSVITKGTTVNGGISTEGALDIMGKVTGDVECLGKVSITGKVTGNVSAAEVFINTDRLEGNVTSEGSVKVGLGTVLIGDIVGTSGVIAGAVKGEIDINGPIVIDSTAIIKGNIKAKSVQINNGAIIDGFCSLTYSDVNIDNIFE
ncbi:MAG TPA: polymer-forming cytoskeletal protein [Clostridiales bacterium]|nr:polymer-forming cytoskeletal protein [Clostridiales bacterium]